MSNIKSLADKLYGNLDRTCLGVPASEFFPNQDEQITHQPAVALCGFCPVKAVCLEYAVATDQRGIWGGTTEGERRARHGQRAVVRPEAPKAWPRSLEFRRRIAALDREHKGAAAIARELGISERAVTRHRAAIRAEQLRAAA
ncbi:MAG TPA: WhiB family transcriptional regulator [Micromonosporaceae bacterium]|nr:WhiB family transcriptional regulator [Micromonosporaceae bacterium]